MLQSTGLADYSVAGRLQQLGDALKVLAPSEDFGWINRAGWRLHSRAEPSKDLRTRLRAADEVFRLGVKLIKMAEQGDFRRTAERACLYRDGLTIAFLVMRPIRSRNLTSMTIGREVERRGADWWLCLGPETSKSGRPFEVRVR